MVNIACAKRGLRFAWKIPPRVRTFFFLFSLSFFFKFRQAVLQLYLTSTFSIVTKNRE